MTTPVSPENKNTNVLAVISGLIGISIIIIVHELGHFLAAHFFNVPTPTFSIGFGPALIKIPFASTLFQISLLPIGGYVEIDQTILAQQTYAAKMIITLAGIVFNVIFSVIIVAYYTINKEKNSNAIQSCLEYISEHTKQSRSGFIGPIGLINLIGKSFMYNKHIFMLILSVISLNIGLFNLLPLPFLDGGKALMFTLQRLMNS